MYRVITATALICLTTSCAPESYNQMQHPLTGAKFNEWRISDNTAMLQQTNASQESLVPLTLEACGATADVPGSHSKYLYLSSGHDGLVSAMYQQVSYQLPAGVSVQIDCTHYLGRLKPISLDVVTGAVLSESKDTALGTFRGSRRVVEKQGNARVATALVKLADGHIRIVARGTRDAPEQALDRVAATLRTFDRKI